MILKVSFFQLIYEIRMLYEMLQGNTLRIGDLIDLKFFLAFIIGVLYR